MSYKDECPGTPTEVRRQAGKNVSYTDMKRRPAGLAVGKFGGLPNGPSGGSMGAGGKRKR